MCQEIKMSDNVVKHFQDINKEPDKGVKMGQIVGEIKQEVLADV